MRAHAGIRHGITETPYLPGWTALLQLAAGLSW
jgi:hypothetical protein